MDNLTNPGIFGRTNQTKSVKYIMFFFLQTLLLLLLKIYVNSFYNSLAIFFCFIVVSLKSEFFLPSIEPLYYTTDLEMSMDKTTISVLSYYVSTVSRLPEIRYKSAKKHEIGKTKTILRKHLKIPSIFSSTFSKYFKFLKLVALCN